MRVEIQLLPKPIEGQQQKIGRFRINTDSTMQSLNVIRAGMKVLADDIFKGNAEYVRDGSIFGGYFREKETGRCIVAV